MKKKEIDFTQGPIIGPLIRFAVPVFLALLLQSLYGAVDLLVVGKFATSADVSAVSTGTQIMQTITFTISSFAVGITIVLGQMMGEGDKKNPGFVVGTAIVFFTIIGLVLSIGIPLLAKPITKLMQAPPEAFDYTVSYITICGAGFLVIIFYNLIGSIFRGIGDSKTPLVAVAIACVFNIFGDLLLCAVFDLGTMGAAIATVAAQLLSVVLSYAIIRKHGLPFEFSKIHIGINKRQIKRLVAIGIPAAINDFLVSISFLVILAVINDLGLEMSAGQGVAEKVCAFIMLVPSAFCVGMEASTAQNIGAGNYGRARKFLTYAMGISFVCGIAMFVLNFFFGDYLSAIFSKDQVVVKLAFDYLRAYAIDCLLTCYLFCMIGYFNGLGMTAFTMIQGIVGAFLVRVPVSIIMSRMDEPSLFHIGLATPCSTILQIVICFIVLKLTTKKYTKKAIKND